MTIQVLAIGRKHEDWVSGGINRFERRLRKPFDLQWTLLSHASREGDEARKEESDRVLKKIGRDDYLLLLDERGRIASSPEIAGVLRGPMQRGARVVVVIGGAYGVDERVRARADFVWGLSKLVFPHQLVRLILAEQIYRAQEISNGGAYHHE